MNLKAPVEINKGKDENFSFIEIPESKCTTNNRIRKSPFCKSVNWFRLENAKSHWVKDSRNTGCSLGVKVSSC